MRIGQRHDLRDLLGGLRHHDGQRPAAILAVPVGQEGFGIGIAGFQAGITDNGVKGSDDLCGHGRGLPEKYIQNDPYDSRREWPTATCRTAAVSGKSDSTRGGGAA